jgi:hypothetical protein
MKIVKHLNNRNEGHCVNVVKRLLHVGGGRHRSWIYAGILLVSSSLTFLASGTLCPRCYWVEATQYSCNNGSCVGAFKIVSDPSYRYCNDDLVDSQFECFTNTQKTVVYIKMYSGTGGSPCPSGCTWQPYGSPYNLEVYECWNDDTDCGGNG